MVIDHGTSYLYLSHHRPHFTSQSDTSWAIPDLLSGAPGGGIGNGPGCLFPGAKLRPLQDADQAWQQIGINHHLARGGINSRYRESDTLNYRQVQSGTNTDRVTPVFELGCQP